MKKNLTYLLTTAIIASSIAGCEPVPKKPINATNQSERLEDPEAERDRKYSDSVFYNGLEKLKEDSAKGFDSFYKTISGKYVGEIGGLMFVFDSTPNSGYKLIVPPAIDISLDNSGTFWMRDGADAQPDPELNLAEIEDIVNKEMKLRQDTSVAVKPENIPLKYGFSSASLVAEFVLDSMLTLKKDGVYLNK
ncbi:MAG: hypothetical protein ACP5N3_00570 [Candidatus Nanoarchaeia archaeon]